MSELRHNLQGTISHMGLPIVGVHVSLYAQLNEGAELKFVRNEQADAKGVYSFQIQEGRYKLAIEPPHGTRFFKVWSDLIDLRSATTCNIALTLGVLLRGHLDFSQESPSQSFRVKAVSKDSDHTTWDAVIEPDSTFMLILPIAIYDVAIYKESTEQLSLAFHNQEVNLDRDTYLEIFMPSVHRLSGRVLKKDLRPVANAKVNLSMQYSFAVPLPLSHSCVTNANGQFEIDLQTARYDITIDPPTGSNLPSLINSLDVTDQLELDFVLASGFTLSGQVKFISQNVSGIRIFARDSKTNIDTVCITDKDGRYLLSLPEGNYTVSIDAPLDQTKNKSEKLFAPYSRPITISADSQMDFKLQEGFIVRFDVTDPSGLCVHASRITYGTYGTEDLLTANSLASLPPTTVRGTSLTDREGKCQIVLPSGIYFFRIEPIGVPSLQSKNIKQLSISTHTRRKVKLNAANSTRSPGEQFAQLSIPIE